MLIKEHYEQLGLDCLVCIGGNGTMKTAYMLSEEGLNVVGIPKTIDNDVWGTDMTFGFDSAVNIATEAIDRLHSTANSHKRIMVIEIMGHNAGWLALYSGMAGGGDVILIPEIPHDEDVIMKYLKKRADNNKPYSIVVVAEGIEFPEGEMFGGTIPGKEDRRGHRSGDKRDSARLHSERRIAVTHGQGAGFKIRCCSSQPDCGE